MTTDDLLQTQMSDFAVLEYGSHTLLVVDDDATTTFWLRQCLEQQGYKVHCAANCAEGWKAVKLEAPSLIILDVGLPDGSGWEMCEQLSDAAETCSIPVIIASGTDDPTAVRTARRVGSRFFLRKPFDPEALLVLIQTALERREEW